MSIVQGHYISGLWDLAYQRTLHCWTLGLGISKNITLLDSGTLHIKEHYTVGLWDLAYQRTLHCWTLGLGISKNISLLDFGSLWGDTSWHIKGLNISELWTSRGRHYRPFLESGSLKDPTFSELCESRGQHFLFPFFLLPNQS